MLKPDGFRMKNSKARDLLEIVLFIEGEYVIDAVVLHDYTVNDVPDAGMI
jgi:hypothetical protein